MKKNFAVIGLGKFGSQVALTLEGLGQNVLAFDNEESVVERVKDYVTSAKILDSTDKEALKDSGVLQCDVAIVGIGNADISSSLMTVLNLKELGVRTIIARAVSSEHGKILSKIGANRVIFPEKESAIRFANQITSSDILEFIEVSPHYQAGEFIVPKEFIGKSIDSLNLPKNYRILVLAIRRGSNVIVIPRVSEKIKQGDILVIVGQTKDIVSLGKKYA